MTTAKKIFKGSAKILLWVLVSLLALILLIFIFINLPYGKKVVKNQVVNYLENKLHTKIAIGKLDYSLPKWVKLQNVYIQDQHKDTLFYGKELAVDLSMFKLIAGNTDIQKIALTDMLVKINRPANDSNFNYQFIIDAFTGNKKTTTIKDTAEMKLTLKELLVKNVVLKFQDVYGGNNMFAKIDQLQLTNKNFQPDRLKFFIDELNARGVTFSMDSYKPAGPQDSLKIKDTTNTQENGLFITAAKFLLQDANVRIDNKITGLHYSNVINRFGITEANFNLNQSVAAAKGIYLDSSKIEFFSPRSTPQKVDSLVTGSAPWLIQVEELGILQSDVKYFDVNKPKIEGLDYSHLNIRQLNAGIKNFKYSKDTTRAFITQLAFSDTSGFVLDSTHADFVMTDSLLTANELYVKTPRSLIRNFVSLSYDSLAGIMTHPANTTLAVELKDSRIAFKDLYLLVPVLKTSFDPAQFKDQYVDLNTKMLGSLARINIPYLQLVGLSGTKINARGTLYNMTNPEKFSYDLYIINSSILKRDFLRFVPISQRSKFTDIPPILNLSGRITGNKNNLLANVVAKGNNFGFAGTVKLSNFSDPANLKFDVNFGSLQITKSLIAGFMPPAALQSINLPERITGKGKLNGNSNNIDLDMRLLTSYGDASVKGFMYNIQNPNNTKYDLAISTPGFNIGKLIKQDSTIGVFAGNIVAKGTGFDPKTMVTQLKANINSFGYNKYDYKDIKLTADINNGKIKSKGIANDPNLALSYDITANVHGKYPTANGYIKIDTAQLQNLHLYDSVLNLSGLVKVDAKDLKPRQLNASLFIDSLRLQMSGRRFLLDTISLIASSKAGIDSINLNAPFATIAAGGAFDYDKVGISLQQYINGYYKLPNQPLKPVTNIPEQQVGIAGTIKQDPIVTALVPGLTAFEDINFNGKFNSNASDSALKFNADIPLLQYNTYKISEGKIGVQAANDKLNYNITFDTLNTGSKLLYGTYVRGGAAHDSISVSARTQDDKKRDWFGLAATATVADSAYNIRLQDSLILNHETWMVAPNNYISYNPQGIIVNNFLIKNDTSTISINSQSLTRNSPIDINVDNFDLETISSIASGDTLLASGVLDIKATVSDLEKPLPGFTGKATVTNFKFLQNSIGDLVANANKVNDNEIAATLSLQGYGNDVTANGNYFLNNDAKQFEANVDLKALSFKTIQAFSAGALTRSSGNISGNIKASGKFTDPRWGGELNFDTAKFTITQLGTPYFIDKQKIVLQYPRVSFPSFTILDSLNHKLIIDGYVDADSIKNPILNLSINAKDFVLVNAKKAIDSQIYGYAAVDANMKVTGSGVSPNVEGNISVNNQSDLTILLPASNFNKDEGEGIVRFIDRDTFDINPPVIPFKEAKEPSNSFAQFLNYNLNIQINKEAALTIVIDPITGDEIKVQGDARLNVGVDPGGNLILAGNYNLYKGYYDFHYQFLSRKFDLKQGSTITFAGAPLDASLNITAIYTAETSAKTLLGNEISNSDAALQTSLNQKLPFAVELNLSGPLSKPVIQFNITLPDDGVNINSTVRGTIESKLAQLRDDVAATNKQVFSLLVFNRFVGEQSSDFFKGNGGDFSDIARQSVSQFLSEALNQIAGDLIKGVDIDLGLSSYNDYSSGNASTRTDLNLALSKSFLNDRLKVSIGQNFGLEGQDPAARATANSGFKPNISLGYKLTKDGKYLLRAYTKNQYEATVDGYVVETGLSFVVTLDYDKFRELFQKKKKKITK